MKPIQFRSEETMSYNKTEIPETMTAEEFLKNNGHNDQLYSSTAYIIRMMEDYAAQQKSEIHKPDVNLEYWQKWLTEHGYQIEFDDDGLWAEDWVQEHKWVDIFDLMLQFAIERQSKMPTEPLERWDAEAWLGKERDIWHHPRISDRTDANSYEVADLMVDFVNSLSGFATK